MKCWNVGTSPLVTALSLLSSIEVTSHVEIDSSGRAWVSGANTMVVEIVLDNFAYGWSPEEMHLQHPHLTLGQIHAALSYYYDHQAEIDSQIADQMQEYEKLRAQQVTRRYAKSCGD